MQRDANNTETVLFNMSLAFLLYGHKAEEWNMTTYGVRGESLDILDKLHWCVMETSFYCAYCVTLVTVGLRTCRSWLDEFCSQVRRVHQENHI